MLFSSTSCLLLIKGPVALLGWFPHALQRLHAAAHQGSDPRGVQPGHASDSCHADVDAGCGVASGVAGRLRVLLLHELVLQRRAGRQHRGGEVEDRGRGASTGAERWGTEGEAPAQERRGGGERVGASLAVYSSVLGVPEPTPCPMCSTVPGVLEPTPSPVCTSLAVPGVLQPTPAHLEDEVWAGDARAPAAPHRRLRRQPRRGGRHVVPAVGRGARHWGPSENRAGGQRRPGGREASSAGDQ